MLVHIQGDTGDSTSNLEESKHRQKREDRQGPQGSKTFKARMSERTSTVPRNPDEVEPYYLIPPNLHGGGKNGEGEQLSAFFLLTMCGA